MVRSSDYTSDQNCFENGGPKQLTADFIFTEHYKTLSEYQQEKRHDLHSREGSCGTLPEKVNVRQLHEQTKVYTSQARSQLGKVAKTSATR